MNYSIIKKCKINKTSGCGSLLEVEYSDILPNIVNLNFDIMIIYAYTCPVCGNVNFINESELPLKVKKQKLNSLKRSINHEQ